MYLVYLLKCEKYSYVGMTNNIFKRIRQHNGEIKGGARYTSKRDQWYPVMIIDGDLADNLDKSVITMQVEAGLAIRMSVLELLLNKKSENV